MNLRSKIIGLILTALISVSPSKAELTVFAAASLSNAMPALAAAYRKQGGCRIHFNFASTGTLARQIEAGAPADIFISANIKWMDWLEQKNLMHTQSRTILARNNLVLITQPDITLHFNESIPGRLAVGNFKSVPVGMYAKEALESMGWLESLQSKLIMGFDARTVLMYVERGEVAAGIVYASDAELSTKVKTIGTFPPDSHSPIVYPMAICSDNDTAQHFLGYLKSNEAITTLKAFGFLEPFPLHAESNSH